ncbi:MAG: hypothetical protein DMD81_09550 [Candidatus Rokuibacteriota bacterium]|nr:MAG: hypothetical protein DMD81_09550 [Candidatus Rokubacteria bacterium]
MSRADRSVPAGGHHIADRDAESDGRRRGESGAGSARSLLAARRPIEGHLLRWRPHLTLSRLDFPVLQALPRSAEFSAHPVTTGIGVAALVVTVASFAGLDISGLDFDIRFVRQPWRLVGSALPHVNVLHLGFNLYWFWRLGTVIEEMLGWWRYLVLIVVAGYLWVNQKASEKTLALMSRSTIGLFVGWFFACIALTATGILAVGNVAHAVGAILGFFIGARQGAPRWRRHAVLAATIAVVIVSLLAAIVRPAMNFSPAQAAAVDGYRGYTALLKNRNLDAALLLSQAVQLDESVKTNWMNLAIASRRLNRTDLALDAWEHALALDPGNLDDRRFVAGLYRSLGGAAQTSGQHKKAVDLLRRAVRLQNDDAAAWPALAVSLEQIGARDEASAAVRRAERPAP